MTMAIRRSDSIGSRRITLLLLTLAIPLASSLRPCRSNSTHIAWKECRAVEAHHDALKKKNLSLKEQRHLLRADSSSVVDCDCCHWQTLKEAEIDAYKYLRLHIMQMDLYQLQTLGFDSSDDDDADGADGLNSGMIGPTIMYALKAKSNYAYCDRLPKSIWREYVLNYASVNEARSNWRPLLYKKLHSLADHVVQTNASAGIPEVVTELNTHMWTRLAPVRDGSTSDVTNNTSIVFVSSQTPLIFDTMSVLTFGYASCTGLAILFINALRSVGIPARLAGTPAWHQVRAHGNHNWVEVWYHGRWYFLEPSPAQATIPVIAGFASKHALILRPIRPK